MQCQLCNKHASVHLTEILNGKKIERHLCQECAQKEGITIKSPPLSELLSQLVGTQEETRKVRDLRCSQCDMNWSDFRKGGLLGCPHDYVAFKDQLGPLICQTQEGATAHMGRVPKNRNQTLNRHSQLLRLRQDLRQAVESEDYEKAASLLEEIKNFSNPSSLDNQ